MIWQDGFMFQAGRALFWGLVAVGFLALVVLIGVLGAWQERRAAIRERQKRFEEMGKRGTGYPPPGAPSWPPRFPGNGS